MPLGSFPWWEQHFPPTSSASSSERSPNCRVDACESGSPSDRATTGQSEPWWNYTNEASIPCSYHICNPTGLLVQGLICNRSGLLVQGLIWNRSGLFVHGLICNRGGGLLLVLCYQLQTKSITSKQSSSDTLSMDHAQAPSCEGPASNPRFS